MGRGVWGCPPTPTPPREEGRSGSCPAIPAAMLAPVEAREHARHADTKLVGQAVAGMGQKCMDKVRPTTKLVGEAVAGRQLGP